MAVSIRPDYATKLRYTIKWASTFWFLLPAFFISTELSTYSGRWASFLYAATVLAIVPLVVAFLWAAHIPDAPRDGITWRGVYKLSLYFSAWIIGLAVLPYFRYSYVSFGPTKYLEKTIVRVDRLTGRQCPMPLNACGEVAPYDPIMTYDAKAGIWRIPPGAPTVRDWVRRHQ